MFLRSAMQIAVGATVLVMGQVVMAEQHDSQAAQDKIVHLNQIQVEGTAAGPGDAKVGPGILTIAKIGISDMKDLPLPGVASGEDRTAAVFIKGFQRVAGIGVVLQA